MHLLIVDTSGIQSYVFGTNRLRDNIGASFLVAQATEDAALARVPTPNNVRAGTGELDDARRIEDAATPDRPALAMEVLYSGGGNLVALFRRAEDAAAFARTLSVWALTAAPGLQLVVAGVPFVWEDSMADGIDRLIAALAREKSSRPASSPLLGLAVTEECASTGLPAVGMAPPIGDDLAYPASAETLAKLAAARRETRPSPADERLDRSAHPPEGYEYPADFDELGGTLDEHSYVAVVHADGDGVGQRIAAIGAAHREPAQNRAYVKALRNFSRALRAAASAALQGTLASIGEPGEVIVHERLPNVAVHLRTNRRTGRRFLPFRPLVFGGDDLTFVCDGRLGLALAVDYLERFGAETSVRDACVDPASGRALSACAGVAIVKTHYPFARAYELADELCRSAKRYRRSTGQVGSFLDWHVAQSGLAGTIDDIRRRELAVHGYGPDALTTRPVAVGENAVDPRHAWPVVASGIEAFQDEKWTGRRNKMKSLRDALRGGPGRVEQFLTDFRLPALPALPIPTAIYGDYNRRGWAGDRCVYFDALELADWYLPIGRAGGGL